MPFKLPLAFVALSIVMIADVSGQSSSRPQQQAACEDDAYRLCPDEIPDEARITSCLARHKASLSPACRAQFESGRKSKR